MVGILPSVISIYGLVSPNILICRFPDTASEKLTSMDGLVSKLSERLQQAALSNSLDDIVCTLAALKPERDKLRLTFSISTASKAKSNSKEIRTVF